jgi:hypothetical protein
VNSRILNKRKGWLDTYTAQLLDTWSKKADALQGLTGALKYFGIKQSGNGFEIDSSEEFPCFRQSLNLFKVVLQKQISKEDIGLTGFDQLPAYDALITIVGFSPEPLMHTALALAPKHVYPVATEESAEHYKVPLNPITRKPDGKLLYFETIIAHYKESSQKITVNPIKRNVASIGSMDTFKRVRQIINEVRQENECAKIALDITGGKKSADVSAFLTAAIERDIDIYYVDFEEYDKGRPKCGTEFLNKLDNPYEIYNIQTLNQAKELFKNYNYQAAYSIFSEIEKRLSPDGFDAIAIFGLDLERAAIKKMKDASQCYEHWDMFEYNEASSEQFHGLLDLSLVRCLKHPGINCKIYEIDNQLEYVKKISLDRYANADRRFQQGRYEDALTRYMQSLEISCKSCAISMVVNEGLTVSYLMQKPNDISGEQIKILNNDTWRQWNIDYAAISGILNWLLCIQKLNWKNSSVTLSLDKRMKTDIKERFCDMFLLDKSLSKRKFEEQVNIYTDLIEDRNKFIHVSTLSINKVQVEVFRDFVYKMLICLYGEVDLTPYMFSTKFDEKGMTVSLKNDMVK